MMILATACGGAFGAVLRYLTVTWAARTFGPAFPYGTMTVNVIGSLVMGMGAAYFMTRGAQGPTPLSVFVMTGILGGFTTFSAFSLDALILMEEGRMIAAMAYIGFSVALSIGALFIGLALARTVLS